MSREILKNAFVTALDIPENEISDQLTYSKHKLWDSTGHMILVAEIESVFDIMLDTDDIIDMSSFAKAQEILTKYDINFS